MADAKVTIKDLATEITTAEDADLVAVWSDTNATTAKISIPNLIASIVTPAVSTEAANRTNADAVIQAEVDLKAPIASPAFTGSPTVPTADPSSNDATIANTEFVTTAVSNASSVVISVAGKTGIVTLDKNDVGLNQVDNTPDLDKPLSTDAIAALADKQNLNALLTSFSGLTTAADQIPYFTGSNVAAVTGLSAFARILLADASATDARADLDVYSKAEVDTDLALRVAKAGDSMSGPLTITTPSGTAVALVTNQTVSGGDGSAIHQAVQHNVTDAGYNAGALPATAALAVNYIIGGTGLFGGRNAVTSVINLASPTDAGNTLRQYIAVTGNATASSGDGGTSSVPQGAMYGSAFVAIVTPTAPYLIEATASESGVEVNTNSAAEAPSYVCNWSLVQLGNHKYHGKDFDASLSLSKISSAVGMLNGILFSDANGGHPVDPSGALIAAQNGYSPGSVDRGIDFTAYTFTTAAIRTPSFEVDGSGNITGGSFIPTGGTFVAGTPKVYVTYGGGANGLTLTAADSGSGATNDVGIFSAAGSALIANPHATNDLTVGGVGVVTIKSNGVQVLGARVTGWGAPTGTISRTPVAVGTGASTDQVLAVLNALITDVQTHGIIGS